MGIFLGWRGGFYHMAREYFIFRNLFIIMMLCEFWVLCNCIHVVIDILDASIVSGYPDSDVSWSIISSCFLFLQVPYFSSSSPGSVLVVLMLFSSFFLSISFSNFFQMFDLLKSFVLLRISSSILASFQVFPFPVF